MSFVQRSVTLLPFARSASFSAPWPPPVHQQCWARWHSAHRFWPAPFFPATGCPPQTTGSWRVKDRQLQPPQTPPASGVIALPPPAQLLPPGQTLPAGWAPAASQSSIRNGTNVTSSSPYAYLPKARLSSTGQRPVARTQKYEVHRNYCFRRNL